MGKSAGYGARRKQATRANVARINSGLEAKGDKFEVKGARQRKEERRKAFREKLEQSGTQASKSAKAVRQGAAVLGDVGSLTDALKAFEQKFSNAKTGSTAKKAAPRQRKKLGNKGRKKLVMEEVAMFKRVIAHPAVKSDPVFAVSTHLRNTYAAQQGSAEDEARGGDSNDVETSP
mmetsp:Transcript_3901/g.6872  ORF Transcript_3901/g.6872 Transcript_3901/m.6872 type:complete len:176 (+) Transcript_3901:84-611(+)